MAIFTQEDLTAVKDALITLATQGYAELTVGGKIYRATNIEPLQALLKTIQADLAGSSVGGVGMRLTKLVPPGCG